MIRRHWRYPHCGIERYYGLGIMSGRIAEWEWFGHTGAFQGFASRTAVLPDRAIAVSLVTNAVDAPTDRFLEGVIHILASFAKHGAPSNDVRDWTGRWWALLGAIDLVPIGGTVIIAVPSLPNPFLDPSEISITGADCGRVSLASGMARHGEDVRRVRGRDGQIDEVWLGGVCFLPEAAVAAELDQRYGG
jgi:hypothetical protein